MVRAGPLVPALAPAPLKDILSEVKSVTRHGAPCGSLCFWFGPIHRGLHLLDRLSAVFGYLDVCPCDAFGLYVPRRSCRGSCVVALVFHAACSSWLFSVFGLVGCPGQ